MRGCAVVTLAFMSAPAIPWPAWAFPLAAAAFYVLASALGLSDAFHPTPLASPSPSSRSSSAPSSPPSAELITHRLGEPYGTLVLTVAVTVIEVALIASVMLGEEGGSPTLARDTVFAVVMIVCNGLVGLCILAGLRHGEQSLA